MTQRDVLHIAAGPASTVDPVSSSLAKGGWRVEETGDVYRGLARMTASASPPRAVIVCVDFLRSDEFEFFALARRHRPGVRILAYADGRLSAKLDQALAVDGVARFEAAGTERLLEGAMPGDTPRRAARDLSANRANGPSAPRRVEAPPDVASSRPSGGFSAATFDGGDAMCESDAGAAGRPLGPMDHEGVFTLDEQERESECDEPAPARVPWGPQQGRPARTPPRPSPPAEPAPRSLLRPAPLDDTPLLSEEELQALIGDDDLDEPFDATDGGRGS